MESNLPCGQMGIFNKLASAGSRGFSKGQMYSAIATSALFPGNKSWSTRGTWMSEVFRHSYCDILLVLSAEREGRTCIFT
jgi:hypothetical protein